MQFRSIFSGIIPRLMFVCLAGLGVGGCDFEDGVCLFARLLVGYPCSGHFSTDGELLEQAPERDAPAMTTAKAGDVIFFGGFTAGATTTASVEVFRADTGTFASATSMANARVGDQAVAFRSGPLKNHVLVASGDKGSVNINTTVNFAALNVVSLTDGEIFNPATGAFQIVSPLTTTRFFYTATLLNDGTVLIAGGYPGFTPGNTAEIFDPATGHFTATTGNMLVARALHTATLLSDGTVLIAGGVSTLSGTVTNTAEIYNPATKTFTKVVKAMPARMASHTATLITCPTCSEKGHVLLTGGFSGVGTMSKAATEVSQSKTVLYDPATKSFTAGPPMHNARSFHTASAIGGGKILIVGGMSGSSTFGFGDVFGNTTNDAKVYANAEIYDAVHNTMTCVGGIAGAACKTSLKYARVGHSATLLTVGPFKGKVLIAGGSGNRFAELFAPAAGKFVVVASAMRTQRSLQAAAIVP